MEWVVNIQSLFGKPEKVLGYLSRYVFRIAISNHHILKVENGKVLFSWKHVLPHGFFKVRYYGFLANRHKKEKTQLASRLLKQEKKDIHDEKREDGVREDGEPVYLKKHTFWDEIWPKIKEYKKPNCPACKKGRLRFAGIVPRE